jgi:hypothetical protein
VEAEPVDGAPALAMLKQWQIQLTARRGIDIMMGARVKDFLAPAGLRAVQSFHIPLPIGPNGGRLGIMAEMNFRKEPESPRSFVGG